MELKDFFKQEKEHIINDCTQCGLCVKHCEVIVKSRLCNEKPKAVQKAVIEFFETGTVSKILQERIKSCMKCYGCLDVCPQDLNPLRSLEICQWEMAEKGFIEYPPWDPKSPDLIHRVLASIQTDAQEYERVFQFTKAKKSKTLFFPTGISQVILKDLDPEGRHHDRVEISPPIKSWWMNFTRRHPMFWR